MSKDESYISEILLKKLSQQSEVDNNTIQLKLTFSIKGIIRDLFTQKTWEKAYNKHDNVFRLTIVLDIKNNEKQIDSKKLIRKAIFFWTRNPKISHRIWIMIVKDEKPFYPLEEEETRSLFFDFEKDITIESSKLNKGKNNLRITVNLSWGKHNFIEKNNITKESNTVEYTI